MAPLPQEKSYTYADMLAWPEGERVELIDGQIIMQAAPSRRHQRIAGEIFGELRNYLRGKKCEVYHAPFDVRLFADKKDMPDNIKNVVEPDIVVICDQDKLDDSGCVGAPDLVIEVLSPTTARVDRLTKFNLYQRAGVREYWIVDPEKSTAQVFLFDEGIMYPAQVYSKDDVIKVEVLDDCNIDLSVVFGL